MFEMLPLVGRSRGLFARDLRVLEPDLSNAVSSSSFLVIGGGGTIGRAVVAQIMERRPSRLDVIDLSENNLVELVRDMRICYPNTTTRLRTFALDMGGPEFKSFVEGNGDYDYVLNLAALKHVRSERDPYTLMRMLRTNIVFPVELMRSLASTKTKKYFCVSTDKAANPVNLMGATKRIMELALISENYGVEISMARFANVAFSDGSLLQGFEKRLEKGQPLVGPSDVARYFITPSEAGLLCLLSCVLGKDREIFFPNACDEVKLENFPSIASRYLKARGLEPIFFDSWNEYQNHPKASSKWPCIFTPSDTTGEKAYEEFYTENEDPNFSRFDEVGVVKLSENVDRARLANFHTSISYILECGSWDKKRLVDLLLSVLPDIDYTDVGLYLDEKP